MNRSIDELGRLVIPIEIRKELNFNYLQKLAISVNDNKIILEKAKDSCFICGKSESLYQ